MNGPGAMAWLAVAAGGAIGSVARYGAGLLLLRAGGGFPVGTLVVNIAGAFLIGLFARLFVAPDHDHVLRLALTTGFCGGFTTFSTFSAETVTLVQQGDALRAVLYVTASLVFGIGATAAGLWLGRS